MSYGLIEITMSILYPKDNIPVHPVRLWNGIGHLDLLSPRDSDLSHGTVGWDRLPSVKFPMKQDMIP